jgi:bifunctional isochorismate lyase/aryl carrier protein
MTIPSIAPYAPPARDELPQSKVHWKPDPRRAVLLIHDMQDYFLNFFDPSQSPLREVLQNVVSIRQLCDESSVPVVYSAQPADPQRAMRGLLTDVWGPGITLHPEQHAIVNALAPRPGHLVLEKTRYSAFHRTGLLEVLRAHGRDQLWICGVFAHIGCMMTACDAFMNDVQPFLIADAVADFSREHHEMSLQFVAGRCGVTLATHDLCSVLCSGQPSGSGVELPLREELALLLDVAPASLNETDELRGLGLDSVRLMELNERLNARGFAVSMLDLMECDTFSALRACVQDAAAPTAADQARDARKAVREQTRDAS